MNDDDDNSTVTTSSPTTTSSVMRPYANDVMSDVTLRTVIVIVYGVIFVLGVCGNALVVYVVVRNPSMQTTTNVFITNLAASDVMMCLLAVPFTPLSGLLRSWVFGEALCHVVPMTLGVSVHVSTLTSTAIAVDRYFVIVHPFRSRIKIPVCLGLIVAIWIVAVSISLPLAVYQKMSWLAAEQVYLCHEQWPPGPARASFAITSLVLQYVLPCAVITFCYVRVSLTLRTRARSRAARRTTRSNSVTTATAERLRQELVRNQRTNRMLIAMTAIFVSCWLPLNVVILALECHPQLERWRYFLLTFFAAHVAAMSSTVYNPFLYAWMNENFLDEFSRVLPWLFRRVRGFDGLGRRRRRRRSASLQTPRSLSQYSLVDNNRILVLRRISCGGGIQRDRSIPEANNCTGASVGLNGTQFPVSGAEVKPDDNNPDPL